MPALFLVMFACIPFAWLWLTPNNFKDFTQSLFAVSIFASNIFFWQESGYFDISGELKPLLHTWSLAVEEQYYLLYPIFLMLAWRFGKGLILAILSSLTIVSLSLADWESIVNPNAAFYLLPMRGWELLIGALVAFYLSKTNQIEPSKFMCEIGGLIGVFLLLFSIFFYSKQTPFPGLYALVPVLGTVLIILNASNKTIVGKFLGYRVFVGIGLISYSAYLWHQPLFAFARIKCLGDANTVLLFFLSVLSFILAYLSWRFVEKPFRNKFFFPKRNFFLMVLIIELLFMSIDTINFNQSIFLKDYELGEYKANNYDLLQESWSLMRDITGEDEFVVDNVPFERKLWFNLNDKRTKVLVVGNSHSVDFFNVLSYSEKAKEYLQLARFGIKHIKNGSDEFFKSPNYINSDVIIICSLFAEGDISEFERIVQRVLIDGKKLFFCYNIFTWMQREEFTKLDRLILPRIKELSDRSILAEEINQIYTNDYLNHRYVTEKRRETAEKVKHTLDILNVKYKFGLIDRMGYVCLDQVCSIVNDDLGKYFFDLGHHTLLGAKVFGMRVDKLNWIELMQCE